MGGMHGWHDFVTFPKFNVFFQLKNTNAYLSFPSLKEIINSIEENLRSYTLNMEKNYSLAIRQEKMGVEVTKYNTTKDLIDSYKTSAFYPDGGFENYFNYILHTMNKIESLFKLTSMKK